MGVFASSFKISSSGTPFRKSGFVFLAVIKLVCGPYRLLRACTLNLEVSSSSVNHCSRSLQASSARSSRANQKKNSAFGNRHSPMLAIRDGDFKLLIHPDRIRVELYDIPRDPTQLSNVTEKHPDLVARLSDQ